MCLVEISLLNYRLSGILKQKKQNYSFFMYQVPQAESLKEFNVRMFKPTGTYKLINKVV